MSATSVTEFGKQHDTTDTTEFCPHQLVTDLLSVLQTCYGETGVMDFGLYWTAIIAGLFTAVQLPKGIRPRLYQ